jgi:hypothetical protein
MSEDKKIVPILVAPHLVKNDGGELARVIAARVVEEKKQAALEAIGIAQKANSEQSEGVKAVKPVSRQQRKLEARNLRKLAASSEQERKELTRLIHEKADEAQIPFQIYVQRMMDSGKENLVEMAKIIRGIR